jgi:LAS superfamily LD-carboxypeptidase LdcB
MYRQFINVTSVEQDNTAKTAADNKKKSQAAPQAGTPVQAAQPVPQQQPVPPQMQQQSVPPQMQQLSEKSTIFSNLRIMSPTNGFIKKKLPWPIAYTVILCRAAAAITCLRRKAGAEQAGILSLRGHWIPGALVFAN